ncbi:MAG: hypothetical protein ABIK92_08525 [Pseudomonadota bacterium]
MIKKLNALLIEYEKIPVKKKKVGYVTAFWKDKKLLSSFYKRTAQEWDDIDNAFNYFAETAASKRWVIDSIFCRAVLYNTLVEIDPQNKVLIQKAINILKDYIAIASKDRLDKVTKNAMEKSIFNNYRKLFDSNLSDEINISVIFHMYIGMNLMRLKEYEKAIIQYKFIANNYPTILLAGSANVQIKTCQDAMDRKLPKDVLSFQGVE